MWIFDSYYKGSVHLWARERGLVQTVVMHPQSFYVHLPDPAAHVSMIEALESLYSLEETRFSTIYGKAEGYLIYADRIVAEKIEKQTRYSAELYNVDIRRDQQYLAERDLFPCGERDESRFIPDFEIPLRVMSLQFSGDPARRRTISEIDVLDVDLQDIGSQEIRMQEAHAREVKTRDERTRRLRGSEMTMLSDLMELVKVHDPDVLLIDRADQWTPLAVEKAERFGVDVTLSRSGRFRSIAARSYWSYGRANHRDRALIPEGRILIDTATSFAFREGGLKGILLSARLSGLAPNLTARFTPGTMISSYEVYEALRRGIAVPFRKRDPERIRDFCELKRLDRGGMILQPEPRLYENVSQIDFTSLYPSIIVKYNLSPETLHHPEKKGFLSSAISPLLDLRIETKRRKKIDARYAGLDSILKWMLVTCFGYTGYRNAKFGQIEVHEQITAISRELLMQIKEIAERMDLEVLHGIVDCLWVRGNGTDGFKAAVENETGILTEMDRYDWIVFLPLADGGGAYNRYFGRLSTGKVKIRGVMARRGDTPEYVRRMQQEIFELLAGASSYKEVLRDERQARQIYDKYAAGLKNADVREMVIHRRLGRLNYARRCLEASAVQAYRKLGLCLAPGMDMGYVVVDADHWKADAEVNASRYDVAHYARLLEKAWRELTVVFELQPPYAE
jgi:DNA polymerase I